MLGDTLRVELAPFDVQGVTVYPSSIFTMISEAHVFQAIAGTINTTFFENQAKHLDVLESEEQ
jgi:hypothetical protein